jgi:hypothetical protein
VFDPLATGIAPTGYMVPMPTVLDQHVAATGAILDAVSGSAQIGSQVQAAVRGFMEGPSEGTPSSRASRNAMPFVQMMSRAVNLETTGATLLAQVNWGAPDQGAEFARLGREFEDLLPEVQALAAAFKGFMGQAKRTFIDCRNPRRLYEDVYTGLLDAVDERPICAANLALAYRFDEALTVAPRETPAESLIDVLGALLAPVGSLLGRLVGDGFRTGFFGFAAMFNGRGAGEVYQEWAADHRAAADGAADDVSSQTERERRIRERVTPKAYVAPETYSIYCSTESTPGGCLIQPLAFVSNDDSNVVRATYLQNPLASAEGDGSVPTDSASPAPIVLGRAFAGGKAVSGANHGALPSAADTLDFIGEKLDAKAAEFCRS